MPKGAIKSLPGGAEPVLDRGGLRVLSLHSGADTGGQASRFKPAMDRWAPGWTFRYATNHASAGYHQYPIDLPFRRRALADMLDQFDVLHAHNDFRSVALVERKYNEKPVLCHYHGTAYRGDPNSRLGEQRKRGAIGVVSTLDLYLIAPDETEWLPSAYNVDALLDMRQTHGTNRIVIAHAPTERTIKSTAHFLAATERLQAEGFPVDVELIERASWAECLRRKSRADIYFDQTILGYGCNALEAWGMGIPVVAGAADETLDEMERRFGHLPFYHATEETIYDALREMVESPELREQYGRIGHEYVRRYHSEEVVVEQLKGLYHRALQQGAKAAA